MEVTATTSYMRLDQWMLVIAMSFSRRGNTSAHAVENCSRPNVLQFNAEELTILIRLASLNSGQPK